MSVKRGTAFENYVKRKIESLDIGYIARARASKGVFDLLLIIDGKPYGIQCKLGSLTNFEKQKLLSAYTSYKIIPIFATKENGRVVFINLLTNTKSSNFLEVV